VPRGNELLGESKEMTSLSSLAASKGARLGSGRSTYGTRRTRRWLQKTQDQALSEWHTRLGEGDCLVLNNADMNNQGHKKKSGD